MSQFIESLDRLRSLDLIYDWTVNHLTSLKLQCRLTCIFIFKAEIINDPTYRSATRLSWKVAGNLLNLASLLLL